MSFFKPSDFYDMEIGSASKNPGLNFCDLAAIRANEKLIGAEMNGNEEKLRDRCSELEQALFMVLCSTLVSTDEHDWRNCKQPSCVVARKALKIDTGPEPVSKGE